MELANATHRDATYKITHIVKMGSKDPVRPLTLPIEKVISLIELLGDRVVDARDAYERYADEDAGTTHRMALLGLVNALEQLCTKEWNVNQQQRKEERRAAKDASPGLMPLDGSTAVSNLRHLLSRMIATNSVAAGALPASTTAPFLSYTDFLACYVAFLNLLHASKRTAVLGRDRLNLNSVDPTPHYQDELVSATMANVYGGSGLDPALEHMEMLAATPKTKKKSRQRRDTEADLEGVLLTPSSNEKEGRGSSQMERDDTSEPHGIVSWHSTNRSSRHHHHHPQTRAADQQPISRSRSVARATGSATSSTSSSTSSLYRRQSITSKRDPTPAYNPELAATASVARQSLTSSASAIRPSKHAQLERNRLLSRAHVERRENLERSSNDNSDANHNNNNEDAGHDGKASSHERPEILSRSKHIDDWFVPGGSTNGDPLEDVPHHRAALDSAVGSPPAPFDRPPSRQRHAFPTHLIDNNGFLAPTPGNASNNTRLAREKSVHSAGATSPSVDTTERPPSRYMTKAKRCPAGASSSGESAALHDASPIARSGSDSRDSSRLLSRRCVESVYSLNQVSHDPKTDGFADVDESVPPPFRIEITTNASPGSTLPAHRTSPVYFSSTGSQDCSHHRRTSLQSRRWSSFSNQEQLQQMAVQSGDHRTHSSSGSAHAEDASRKHPRFDRDFDSDARSFASDSALERSEYFPARSGPPVMAVPTSKSVNQISDQQWILASNNPFFYSAPAACEFDDMDPETAIAQTPLYESDDLMTIATEMSDLHLDYSVLGELQPMPLSIAVGTGGARQIAPTASSSNPSPPLHTSLGKDSLCLFAQH
ncbi:hypothetical protein FI667_g3243, partial [Globisporangium splendens]